MNDIEIKEELLSINSKIDHIGRIVSELFITSKLYDKYDNKLDICIKSLNNLIYKVEQIEKPRPLAPASYNTRNSNKLDSSESKNSTNINNISYMAELKEKLKERQKKYN